MLLFLDGQAHYDTTGLPAKYSAVDSTGCAWSIVAEGRQGNCIKRVSTSGTSAPGGLDIAPLTTRTGTWSPTVSGVCGFAIKIDDLSRVQDFGMGGTNIVSGLFLVFEGSVTHLSLLLNSNGTLSLFRFDGSSTGWTLLQQSSEGLTAAQYLYVECKWVIDASAGSFLCRVNNTVVLSYSGKTRASGSLVSALGVWNAVRLAAIRSASAAPYLTLRLCDLYLADLASALPADVSDFLGDGVITTIYPNGPSVTGGPTQWTTGPTPGGVNWQMVDEHGAHDGDTTYVSTTSPATDIYAFEDIPAASIVKGAQLVAIARKAGTGSALLTPLVREAGTTYPGPTQGVSSVVYDRYVTQTWDVNPATNNAFTAAEINNGEYGLAKS